jgi:hypothetical protein
MTAMVRELFTRRVLGRTGAVTALAVMLAAAPAQAKLKGPGDAYPCLAPSLSQPFLPWGDANWYTLAPGETLGNFDGTGWTLSGGARVLPTTTQGGTPGTVLDLPSGASAVSPPMCVTPEDPKARAMVRDVAGTQGVRFAISYLGTTSWQSPQSAGHLSGGRDVWAPSHLVELRPKSAGLSGWLVVRFTFTAIGPSSDTQIYNYFVDPRMHH